MVGLMACVLAGCGETETRSTASRVPARGYHPEQFPDIPLVASFALDPSCDQLALAIGGSLVRRFQVSLVQRNASVVQSPAEVLDWYSKILPGLGWTAELVTGQGRSFSRQRSAEIAERLQIVASRSGVTRVELRLMPMAPTPTMP